MDDSIHYNGGKDTIHPRDTVLYLFYSFGLAMARFLASCSKFDL